VWGRMGRLSLAAWDLSWVSAGLRKCLHRDMRACSNQCFQRTHEYLREDVIRTYNIRLTCQAVLVAAKRAHGTKAIKSHR